MSDAANDYCHGEYSLWQNAIRYGGASSGETAKMMPEGWGSAGETRSGTIHDNAVRGLWLPLFIPEGCDGHLGQTDPQTGELLPEVIFYAANHVASDFDQKFPAVNSSPDGDQARYDYAVSLGLDAAKYTSGGSPWVRVS